AAVVVREGASVRLASLRKGTLDAATRQLASLGRVESLTCDVTSEADVKRLVQETLRRFRRLDVMVANAGVADPYKNLLDTSVAEWDRMIGIHMRGTFLCGREAARAMRDAKIAGRIVTISSTSAFECDPLGGSYNAAKAGIVGLTRSMAIDFADCGI